MILFTSSRRSTVHTDSSPWAVPWAGRRLVTVFTRVLGLGTVRGLLRESRPRDRNETNLVMSKEVSDALHKISVTKNVTDDSE